MMHSSAMLGSLSSDRWDSYGVDREGPWISSNLIGFRKGFGLILLYDRGACTALSSLVLSTWQHEPWCSALRCSIHLSLRLAVCVAWAL